MYSVTAELHSGYFSLTHLGNGKTDLVLVLNDIAAIDINNEINGIIVVNEKSK